MSFEQLQQSLQPVQIPAAAAAWPPAAGFWLALIVVLLILVPLYRWRRSRHGQPNYQLAQSSLQQIAQSYRLNNDSAALINALARWLKQVAILAYPEHRVAGLTGQRWLEFLDSVLQGADFTDGCGQLFARRAYSEHAEADANRLLRLCQRWLEALEPKLQTRSSN